MFSAQFHSCSVLLPLSNYLDTVGGDSGEQQLAESSMPDANADRES